MVRLSLVYIATSFEDLDQSIDSHAAGDFHRFVLQVQDVQQACTCHDPGFLPPLPKTVDRRCVHPRGEWGGICGYGSITACDMLSTVQFGVFAAVAGLATLAFFGVKSKLNSVR